MKYTEINHPSHPHTLILKPTQAPYTCDGCKELVLFELCYQCECEECNFHLHEECAMPDPSIFHKFPKKCEFKFHEEVPGGSGRVCDACGKDVLGFMYQCSHEDAHDLHPRCAKLPHTLSDNGVKLYLRKKAPTKCLICQTKKISKRVEGWSYVSSCDKYCYHVACVKVMMLESWKKDYFPQHGDVAEASSAALQIMAPSQEVALQNGKSSIGSKAKKFWQKAKLVLSLIISAILGDPLGLIGAVLVESLFSN